MMYSNIFSETELCNQLTDKENNVPGIYVNKTKKQAIVSCSIQSEKLLLKAAGHIPSSVRLMERDYSDFLFSGFFAEACITLNRTLVKSASFGFIPHQQKIIFPFHHFW